MMPISAAVVAGTWDLVSFTITKKGKKKNWRPEAHGILIYTKDGSMSVAINGSDPEKPTIDNLLFYAGNFKVEGNQIIHRVLNATDPGRIGQDLTRDAVLDGDTLQLSATGSFGTATVRWRRR